MIDDELAILLSAWGKARPRPDAPHPWHPLAYHCLDVAAVGEAALASRPWLAAAIARDLGWAPDQVTRSLPFLLALHDIGKLALTFQAKCPELWPARLLGTPSRAADPGHGASGLTLLRAVEGELADLFPGWRPDMLDTLLAPFLGHHGRPVRAAGTPVIELLGPRQEAVAAARLLIRHLRLALAPCPVSPPDRLKRARRASWRLAGLAVLADWVGSSQVAFPYHAPTLGLADYLATVARLSAEAALRAVGIVPVPPMATTGLRALSDEVFAPSDVQAWTEAVPLPEGPVLALLEDVTGSGKTEAALVLAHRLMAEGRAHGLWAGLPTMATANAMFDRMANMYRRLFVGDRSPSLALAHGRARLHPGFVEAARLDPAQKGGDEAEADRRGDASGAACAAWIASEQRKSFLAEVGVGTIDQAILGVLPSRYQALRLLGLAERVLIVDEAHAYDAYMSRELAGLIEFQAALGGHVVILSATLPRSTKAELARAFARGLDIAAPPLTGRGYPLVTLVSAAGAIEEARAPRPDLKRQATIERLPDAGTALQRIAGAAAAGAAVAWIRNSVDDALEAVAALRTHGIDAELFHARFAMGDRLAIERRVVGRWGRKGDPAGRPGVLVATQVIEQSLDLDFDLIVTDLAPIDLLLQRLGRLWRHTWRPRPIPGPHLLIVSPAPVADPGPGWYRDLLPRASWVYRDHALLWLTARRLFVEGGLERGERALSIPEDVPDLVESVYDQAGREGLPPGLERAGRAAEQSQKVDAALARRNLLSLDRGYGGDHAGWADEAHVPTRLGDDTVTFRLGRIVEGRIGPWWRDPETVDEERAWSFSEVTVRRTWAKDTVVPPTWAAATQAVRVGWGPHDADKPLLVLEHDGDGGVGTVVDRSDATCDVCYDPAMGLRRLPPKGA
jgi:CRISPR-associated endonuclease/helicase Cas3